MAVTFGTISTFGGSSDYPWTFNSPATIDTSGAKALLVFISNAAIDKSAPTVKFGGSGGQTMALLGTANLGNGMLWAFGLVAPTNTNTGSLYVNHPSANGDPANYTVIPLTNCDGASPFGTIDFAFSTNGGTITNSIVTAGAASTVISAITAVYGPAIETWTTTGTPTVQAVINNTTQTGIPMKVVKQVAGAAGSTVTSNNDTQYNSHGILSVEVKDSSGPTKQLIKPTGINNSSNNRLGYHIVKDPNVSVLAPPGIINLVTALGAPTVSRSQIATYEFNGSGNVASGSPAVIVERTSVAANYRNSRASVPIVNGEKRYWEITVDFIAETSIPAIGLGEATTPLDTQLGGWQSPAVSWDASGGARQNNTGLNGKGGYIAGDIMMIAVDMVNGWVFMGKNGQWYNGSTAGSVNFTSGDGKVNDTNLTLATPVYPMVQTQNIGDKFTSNFGRAALAYTPPAGFTALDAGGPVKKTLTAPAIINTNEFGTHQVNLLQLILNPPSIVNASEMGAHSIIQLAGVSGLVNTSVLGSHNVVPLLEPASLLNSSALGSPSVAQLLEPAGIANSSVLEAPSLVQWLHAPGIEETPSMGTPVVQTSYSMAAPSITNASALGDHEIKPKNTLTFESILNVSETGEPALIQQVSAPSIVNVSAYGSHTLNQGIKAPGIENVEELGNPTVNRGAVQLQPEGLLNTSETGTPVVHQIVAPEGIDSTAALGNPFVTHIYEDAGVHPASIININLFGNSEVVYGIKVFGIEAPQSVFGSHIVAQVPKLLVPSIENASLLGNHELGLTLKVTGIGNVSDVGDPAVRQQVSPTGIDNVSGLGLHALKANNELYHAGMANTSAVGTPTVRHEVLEVEAPSIVNTSELGEIRINYVVYQDGIGNISILGNHTVQVGAAEIMPVSIINDNYLGNPVVSIVVGENDKFIRHDGQWRAVETVLVKYESQWHELDKILEKKDGVWVQIFWEI